MPQRMTPKEELAAEINDRILSSDSLSVTEIVINRGDGRKLVFELNGVNKYDVRSEVVDDVTYEVAGHPVELVVEVLTQSRIEVVAVQMDVFDAAGFLREWRRNPYPEDCPSFDLKHVEAIEEWGGVNRKHELEAKHVQDAFQEYYRLRDTVDDALFF